MVDRFRLLIYKAYTPDLAKYLPWAVIAIQASMFGLSVLSLVSPSLVQRGPIDIEGVIYFTASFLIKKVVALHQMMDMSCGQNDGMVTAHALSVNWILGLYLFSMTNARSSKLLYQSNISLIFGIASTERWH